MKKSFITSGPGQDGKGLLLVICGAPMTCRIEKNRIE